MPQDSITLTIEELRALRNELPHGAQKEIADEIGVSPALVHKCLQGIRHRPDIIDAAITKRDEHRQKIAEIKSRIQTSNP